MQSKVRVQFAELIDSSREVKSFPDGPGRLSFIVYAAAGLSVMAALTHLWVVPEHLQEWWVYGIFFLVSALAQGLFATALLRWPKLDVLLLAGIAGNLAISLLYILMHYLEGTIGPGMGHRENLDILGIGATAVELGLVVILATLLDGAAYRRAAFNGLFLAGALVWTLKLAGF